MLSGNTYTPYPIQILFKNRIKFLVGAYDGYKFFCFFAT